MPEPAKSPSIDLIVYEPCWNRVTFQSAYSKQSNSMYEDLTDERRRRTSRGGSSTKDPATRSFPPASCITWVRWRAFRIAYIPGSMTFGPRGGDCRARVSVIVVERETMMVIDEVREISRTRVARNKRPSTSILPSPQVTVTTARKPPSQSITIGQSYCAEES